MLLLPESTTFHLDNNMLAMLAQNSCGAPAAPQNKKLHMVHQMRVGQRAQQLYRRSCHPRGKTNAPVSRVGILPEEGGEESDCTCPSTIPLAVSTKGPRCTLAHIKISPGNEKNAENNSAGKNKTFENGGPSAIDRFAMSAWCFESHSSAFHPMLFLQRRV